MSMKQNRRDWITHNIYAGMREIYPEFDMEYNQFCKWLDTQAKNLGEKNVRTEEHH